MAPARPTRSRSGALCRQLLLTLTVSGRPAPRGGLRGMGAPGEILGAGVRGGVGGGQSGG